MSFEAGAGDIALVVNSKIDTHLIAATGIAEAASAAGKIKAAAMSSGMGVRKDVFLVNARQIVEGSFDGHVFSILQHTATQFPVAFRNNPFDDRGIN